ncbi:RHS repeat domain-containing protein [Agromyces silvae]|uniref:RHS repeat domain-containing protein n=1 Tax=Agromyces silvae TaxID=3388266 RepID=UPI00280AE65B|nr:RHS repeat-associated core domain-containing protein [Agromyces protaetiae]
MAQRNRAFGSALLGGLVSVAIAAGGVTAAWGAGAEGGAAEAPVVGGFGVGDATEAMIDERDGSVQLSVPVADLALTWDSRAVAAGDQTGFGRGWGLGLTRLGVHGGVTVALPSGGVHEADDTQPSGLAGYGVGDLRFDVTPGRVLEGRADGAAGEIAYAYTLAELGGAVTYFDTDGRPVARIGARGLRADWRWDGQAGDAAKLRASVSADGVVTELDWRDPGEVLVRQAVNLPPADDGVERIWRVRLDGGRVERVVDPVGAAFAVGYTREGLVSRASAASGAHTELTWRAYTDQVPRIETIRTVDPGGAELSVRHWQPVGGALPSGWPQYGGDRELFFSHDAAFRYVTEVSDGATSVRSTYRSLHTMESRDLRVSGASGEQVLRRHAYSYPMAEGGELPDPRALPGNWSRPAEAVLTHLGQGGADRAVRTEYEIDDFGRTVRESGVDGTVTETEYAPGEPGATRPPIGLAVRERVTGPDGSIAETRHTLDAAGSAVVATETLAGDDPEALTVTSRTEFTVEADGFVSEQRAYPSGDPAATPVITRWQRTTDLAAGERTVTETMAAGTEAEATTATTVSLVHGGAVSSVDAAGNQQAAGYDVLGRVIATDDGTRRNRVEYDAFGNAVRSTSYGGDAPDAPETSRAEYDPMVGGDVRTERVWASADTQPADVASGEAPEAPEAPSADPGPADAAPADAAPADATGLVDEPVTRTFEYSPLGELAAVTTDGERVAQEYDVAGNLARAADGTEYRYDAANRVVAEIRDGQRTDTQYWADGARRGRSSDAGAVTFYWDGDTLLTEEHRDAAGAAGMASYLIGAGRHARVVAPSQGATETAYYGTDRHGNVTELTDGGGAITTRYVYSDYGRVTVRGGGAESDPLRTNPFQYAGGYTHADGTQWLRVRTYDPVAMRFLTMDEADLLNGYNFADLNPIMLVDPSGRAPEYDTAVDLVVLTAAVALAFSMAAAAIFTGGWSLTMLGIAGWVADAVTIGTSVYRLDATVRGRAIDPEVETALFATEIAFTAVGVGALAHTVRNLPKAEKLHSAASKLTFTELNDIAELPSRRTAFQGWLKRNGGHVDEQLRTGTFERFDRDRKLIDDAIAHEEGRLTQTKTLLKDSWKITEASGGSWLTRPLLAAPTARRTEDQLRNVVRNVKTLDDYSKRWWAEWGDAAEVLVSRTKGRPPRPKPSHSWRLYGGDEYWVPPESIPPQFNRGGGATPKYD